MEGMTSEKPSLQPKTIAELLPSLNGILSKSTIQTLSTQKKPRSTIAPTRTTEKIKPLTIAEVTANLQALKQCGKKTPQLPSTRKMNWNSSVKVEKKRITQTAEKQMKPNTVRKMLNFQSSKTITKNIITSSETPKFIKPEQRPRKFITEQNNIRISGVYNMLTPAETNTSLRRRITKANKENITSNDHIIRKSLAPPKSINRKTPRAPDTPLSNDSEASFLQREKEIHDIEEKTRGLIEEPILENIAEVSPPASTPFKEYRHVQECFNNTSDLENSIVCNNDTIMCFNNPSVMCKETENKEESGILSLCDMLNKATVTNTEIISTELDCLLEIEKETLHNLKVIEDVKKSQLKSLHAIRKLIQEKKNTRNDPQWDKEKTLVEDNKFETEKGAIIPPTPVLGKRCSVIKICSKSPSYKIPKKGLNLRKNLFHHHQTQSEDNNNKALSTYLKMKEQMNFLRTPIAKSHKTEIPDTPAITSYNLQVQLDKLYNNS